MSSRPVNSRTPSRSSTGLHGSRGQRQSRDDRRLLLGHQPDLRRQQEPRAPQGHLPRRPGGDLVHSIVAPGGAVRIGFLPMWLTGVNSLKMIPNVASMLNRTFDWKWLASRVHDPRYSSHCSSRRLPTRVPSNCRRQWPRWSTRTARSDATTWTTPTRSASRRSSSVGGSTSSPTTQLRMYTKAATAHRAETQLFMARPTTRTWATRWVAPANRPTSTSCEAWRFDRWLKGIDNGIDRFTGPVTLYQRQRLDVNPSDFPRPGMSYQRMYLSGRRSGGPDRRSRRDLEPGSSSQPLDHRPGSSTTL